ncbi:flavin reductase family protein [Brevundimonas sp.]|uniref:flavin reductase family protein n=1 Tax=Brevundimonas sp. TaxID=1871086 RepID=UPI003AF5E3B4
MTNLSPSDSDGLDARAYRRAMGAFATGVCVVTVDGPEGPVGMTVNSVTSVSLEPRLLLWCLDDSAERAGAFLERQPFSVHVLGADEADWADRFSRGDCRLAAEEVGRAETGAPVLAGALARFDCELHAQIAMGDHQILVGRVTHFEAHEGAGLTFFRGRYGRIQEGVE